jgi:pimeloyl-ACP methyl ester carboxylesterase
MVVGGLVNVQTASAQIPLTGLYDTGVDSSGNILPNGANDPYYAIVADSSDGSIASSATVITSNLPVGSPGAWVSTNTASAWVTPAAYANNLWGAAVGYYDWQTSFTLPQGATSVSISGNLAVDDDMPGGILLNGTKVLADPTGNDQFAHLTPFSFTSSSVVAGTNTLLFQTYNQSGPTGLRVDGITATYTSTPLPTDPVGIQFVQAGPTLGSSQVAGVVPQDDFNPVYVANSTGTSGTTGDLVDANGNTTGITLTHVSNDGFNTSTDTTTPNGILLNGEDKTGPPGHTQSSGPGLTATYTFNNVPSGSYNLIAYIETDSSSAGVTANMTVGSTTYYVADQATSGTPAFSLANNTNPSSRVTGNYVEFYNVTPSAGTITLTNTSEGGANDTAAINGLQLLPQFTLTQTTQTPNPTLLNTNPAGSGNLLYYNSKAGFVTASKTLGDPGYVNPNLPTVVLTLGFDETDNSKSWPALMAAAFPNAGGKFNIVAWNWANDADSGNLPYSASRAANQGSALASALLSTLGSTYDSSIHFVGHSLGTLVNSQAINTFYATDSNVQIQDTLFDEASIAYQTASPSQPLASTVNPIPNPGTTVRVDNYISSFGNIYSNATNIILTNDPTNTLATNDASYWINFHDYPISWYQSTFPGSMGASAIIGYSGAIEGGGFNAADPTYQLGTYYKQDPSSEFNVSQIGVGTAAQYLLQRNTEEINALQNQSNLGYSIAPFIASHYFGVSIWQLTGAIQYQNSVLATTELLSQFGSPGTVGMQLTLGKQLSISNSVLQTLPAGAASGQATLSPADATSPTNYSSYAFVPLAIPSGVQFLALDFSFNNLSPDDLLSIGVDDTPLFQLEDQFASNGVTESTGLLDVSQWSGQDVQLFLGLVAADTNNLGGTIVIDDMSFASIPEPTTLSIALSVLLLVSGRKLGRSKWIVTQSISA